MMMYLLFWDCRWNTIDCELEKVLCYEICPILKILFLKWLTKNESFM